MPIVVGVGRSGTTLLRLMLDSHPELAMPPETGFLPRIHHERETLDAAGLVELLTAAPTWPDFHLDPSELRAELDRNAPFSASEGARSFYRLYARRFEKERWGDKTPVYCRHMPAIQELLPEARFIHLIRDGRDVAVSLRPLWFAPSRDVADLAVHWQDWIGSARRGGASCRHYLEVRYEDLIGDAAATLRRVCDFVELPFAAAMLDYPSRAAGRIGEVRDQQQPGFVVTREQRLRQHPFVTHAPRSDRVGRWRNELTPEQVQDFEAVAGELLVTLGYERAS
jgi:sulfotransferase family protein